ncbi:MAG: AMP-binding protein, partial [Myxococcota bacterium]
MEVPLGHRGNVAWDLVGDPERAERVAVHFVSARAEHRAFTFGELHRRSSQGASVLRAQGLAKGDRAVSVIPRIPAFYDALLSCMKIGAVAMPGTNLLTAGDLAYRIRRAGAKAVIVHEAHAAKIDEIADACPSLEHRFVIGGSRSGWIDWTAELESSSALA